MSKLENLSLSRDVSIAYNLEVNNISLTLILGSIDDNLYLSSRNLHNVNLVSASNFSTYDIVNSKMILFDKESIEILNERLK